MKIPQLKRGDIVKAHWYNYRSCDNATIHYNVIVLDYIFSSEELEYRNNFYWGLCDNKKIILNNILYYKDDNTSPIICVTGFKNKKELDEFMKNTDSKIFNAYA